MPDLPWPLQIGLSVFWVWALIDVFYDPRLTQKERPLWLFLIFFAPVLWVVYYFSVRRKRPIIATDNSPESLPIAGKNDGTDDSVDVKPLRRILYTRTIIWTLLGLAS